MCSNTVNLESVCLGHRELAEYVPRSTLCLKPIEGLPLQAEKQKSIDTLGPQRSVPVVWLALSWVWPWDLLTGVGLGMTDGGEKSRGLAFQYIPRHPFLTLSGLKGSWQLSHPHSYPQSL